MLKPDTKLGIEEMSMLAVSILFLTFPQNFQEAFLAK